MRILSVGSMVGISNTCRHRNNAFMKIADDVDVVNTSTKPSLWFRIAYHLFGLGLPVKIPDLTGANSKILQLINTFDYDIVWIDKGITIEASTMYSIKKKQSNVKLVSYSPDNMALRHNQSLQYLQTISLYDYIVTNKSYILNDLKRMGAKNVIFVNNTIDPTFHYPRVLTDNDRKRLGGDVGFVGCWEEERCNSILYLSRHGINVKVYGDERWKKYENDNPFLDINVGGLFNEDYSKSFSAFKISLCFLRKMNYDVQTTRTVEIPACGGFMIAERTDEQKALFEEDKEAVYFSSNEELLEKCRYYLCHEEERISIAKAGNVRCIVSDYTNEGMIRRVIKRITQD